MYSYIKMKYFWKKNNDRVKRIKKHEKITFTILQSKGYSGI